MTTQESLLALARAVYPNRAFRADGVRIVYEAKTSWVSLMGPVSSITDVAFDPANNSEQAMEVLCWLIRAANCGAFRNGTVDFRQTAIVIGVSIMGDESRASYFEHDGTPASLRSAIVQAACRVVGG